MGAGVSAAQGVLSRGRGCVGWEPQVGRKVPAPRPPDSLGFLPHLQSQLACQALPSLLPSQRLAAMLQLSGHVAVVQFLQTQQQLLQVFPGSRRQGDGLLAQVSLQLGQLGPGLWEVDLVCHDGVGSLGQAFVVLLQLILQVVQLSPGLWHREVYQEQKEGAALDVPEEGQAQAPVLVGTPDDAGDVSHCGGDKQTVRRGAQGL